MLRSTLVVDWRESGTRARSRAGGGTAAAASTTTTTTAPSTPEAAAVALWCGRPLLEAGPSRGSASAAVPASSRAARCRCCHACHLVEAEATQRRRRRRHADRARGCRGRRRCRRDDDATGFRSQPPERFGASEYLRVTLTIALSTRTFVLPSFLGIRRVVVAIDEVDRRPPPAATAAARPPPRLRLRLRLRRNQLRSVRPSLPATAPTRLPPSGSPA